MKKEIQIDFTKHPFPIFMMGIGFVIMLLQWILHLNLVTLIGLIYCCITAAVILIGVLAKKKLYSWFFIGYTAVSFGIATYFIFHGADAGFGAFSSGLAGFHTADHPWLQGEGNLGTRLLGNIMLAAPSFVVLLGTYLIAHFLKRKKKMQVVLTSLMSLLLVGTTVLFVLTTNLRAKPNAFRLWEGQDEYLKNMDRNKNGTDSPNVLFILMDDLGYGDVSANGAIYNTPNIDRIAQEGVSFDHFYASYSVCSPSRFAALTGRYPYRGYADNVMYPTISTFSPFAATRLYNSFEMGANCDGMLGDEITMAEAFQSAGYATGCFGKWHLGDYGEYLPTNQGFDYFYGSHHVNDMVPFYHSVEENGEYEIVHGTDELKDQSKATEWIHNEITDWITNVVTADSDQPFFAYYTTPWPHAPIFVGEDYRGASGMGDYVDCVMEFDAYLGQLFQTLEDLGELDDTIIIFTSDNGPALQGSTNELRGGKYLAYEGGQKVPFFMRWGNSDGLFQPGSTVEQSATLVDLFPTLVEICGLTGYNGTKPNYMPFDREIDGVSMVPAIQNGTVIHTEAHPILHMKREKIKALQYTIPTADVLSREEYSDYDYDVLTQNDHVTFKYFKNIQNDNSAFFDKYRKNWLHILTDDSGENYNRTPAYPTIAAEMEEKLEEWTQKFKENRRGYDPAYYQEA